jgi:glycosyltransferase involved in cell wall biosynthesis
MRILHINTFDKLGGAAIAAFRLHNAMLSYGINSRYLVLNRTINDRTDILTVSNFDQYIKKLINKIFDKLAIHSMRARTGLFSSFKYGFNISHHPEILNADVIYLHWINTFVNYQVLKRLLKTGKPVFWFMHDMFPITGGCHHSFECTNYQIQCRKCPYYRVNYFCKDISVWQYKIKRKIYKHYDNLVFIAPSKWLFDCAKKSGLTQEKKIYHIPNLIDSLIFKPLNKDMARQLFSLDGKKKIIGFGADHALLNPYKGWDYLKNALQILSEDKILKDLTIEILIFGSSYSEEIESAIPFHTYFLGHLNDEYSLVMAYNCMDVFVISSLAENFPNTILESLNCNTPVVGFNVGGISDTINTNTGYLAEYKNSKDLAKGISLLLRQERKDLRSYIASFDKENVIKQHFDCLNIHLSSEVGSNY